MDNGDNRNLELSSRNLEGVKLVASRDVNVYDLLGHEQVLLTQKRRQKLSEACNDFDHGSHQAAHRDRKRASTKKDAERTLCFEVAADANKTQIKKAVRSFSR